MIGKKERAPVKVLIVIGSLEIGGAEKHVTDLATLIKSSEVEVSICALMGSGPLEEKLRQKGIKLFFPQMNLLSSFIGNIRFLRAIFSYFRSACIFLFACRRVKPHIVHFFLPGAYIIGGLASLMLPNLVRIMSRRSLNHYQRKKPIFRAIERLLHKKMWKIIGNSKSVIEDLMAEGVPEGKVALLYNGVDAPKHLPLRKKSPAEPVEILCVANLIPYKGHLDLLQALSKIPRVYPWHLTCVGRDDGCLKELEAAALNLGISGCVDFIGSVIDPYPFLFRADIGVNCSHQEGFSNSVLEYMSLGLGIVVTDAGGNAEAIRDEIDGLVVPVKDVGLMSQAIRRLFDADARRLLGGSARQRAMNSFSVERCVQSYSDIYLGITAKDIKKC